MLSYSIPFKLYGRVSGGDESTYPLLNLLFRITESILKLK
jgi:hypothetical protein